MESEKEKKIRHFVYYAQSGQLDRVRDSIKNGSVDINSTNTLGDTALHAAASSGKLEIINYLISNGASVDFKVQSSNARKEGATSLFYAVMKGNLDVVKALLNYGASTNVIVYDCDILDASIQSNNPEIVSLILDLGFNVNRHGLSGITPLAVSLRCSKYETAEFLLEKGADYKKLCSDGSTSLIHAIHDSTGKSVELLIKYVQKKEGVDFLPSYVNFVPSGTPGRTALHTACYEANYKAIKILLSVGANPNIGDSQGHLAHDLLPNLGDKHIYNEIKLLLKRSAEKAR